MRGGEAVELQNDVNVVGLMAAKNKCLSKNNKSLHGGDATKK